MTSGLKYGMLCLTLSAAAFGQALAIASVPADPLELAVGPIQTAGTPVRASALQLLERARSNYQLRNAGQGISRFASRWTRAGRQTSMALGPWKIVLSPGADSIGPPNLPPAILPPEFLRRKRRTPRPPYPVCRCDCKRRARYSTIRCRPFPTRAADRFAPSPLTFAA